MSKFEHLRHKPPTPWPAPCELVLVCAPLRSQVNLSRMVRTAGCCGVPRVIACGRAKLDPAVARDAVDTVQIEARRSILPVLRRLSSEGYRLVGLEQTTSSQSIYDYRFASRTALVVGNERAGLEQDSLDLLDDVVEIPVYGAPASFNAASSVDMALYEYCRQHAGGRFPS